MEYRLVTADSTDELEARVSEYLENGFEPQGGVSVVRYELTNERKGYTESEWLYVQAMVKRGAA